MSFVKSFKCLVPNTGLVVTTFESPQSIMPYKSLTSNYSMHAAFQVIIRNPPKRQEVGMVLWNILKVNFPSSCLVLGFGDPPSLGYSRV